MPLEGGERAPVSASHSRAVLCRQGGGDHPLAVGAERGASTRPVALEGGEAAPVSASHSRAVSSSEAVTSRLPSGLNTAL